MSDLNKLKTRCKRRLEGDTAMLASEHFAEKPEGDLQFSVKAYRYSENLLNSHPDSGGLLVNEHSTGRPVKYPFGSLLIGGKLVISKPLSQVYSLSRYWEKKLNMRFRLKSIGKGETEAVRIG